MPHDAGDVIDAADTRREEKNEDARVAYDFFADSPGTLYTHDEAVDGLLDAHDDWEKDRALRAVINLVDDTLDPVQQVVVDEVRYVGVLGFEDFQDSGGYGFIEYDDVHGKRRVVTCYRCIESYDVASEPFRCIEGVGRHHDDCGYEPLVEHLTDHYDEHDAPPSEYEVAASLVSGTTIAASSAFHQGNLSPLETTGGTISGPLSIDPASGSLQLPTSFN